MILQGWNFINPFATRNTRWGLSNADEREVLRRWEVATVSGGEGPIELVEGSWEDGLVPPCFLLGNLVPCIPFPYSAGKDLLS
jgi:hypothetical protein